MDAGSLGGFIASLFFLVIFFVFLRAGRKASEYVVDKTVDTAFTGARLTKKALTPVVNKTIETLLRTEKAIIKPNTFCETWSLVDFINTHGTSVGIQSHVNKATGELFYTCEVRNPIGKSYSIRFSSSLGNLTSEEVSKRKKSLFVGKTNAGKYYMFDTSFKDWEDVPLE